MRKIFNKKFLFRALGIGLVSVVGVVWIMLVLREASQYKRFRTMQDEITVADHVDLTGLRELPASGGFPPDFSVLTQQLAHVKQPIIIVDGRPKERGYIAGHPLSYFGWMANPSAYKSIFAKGQYFVRRLVLLGTLTLDPDRIVPEEEMAKRYGYGYVNIPFSRFESNWDAIDLFVSFLDSFSQNTWIHCHCDRGDGRTSLMLVLFDIMKNAPQVALQDIFKRQALLGSDDLSNTTVWKKRLWRKSTHNKQSLLARKQSVEQFYAFICQRKAGGIRKWSEWLRQMQHPPTPLTSPTDQ